MDRLDNSLEKLLATPFCPTCATLYEPEHYDTCEERACCPNCGTEYCVPADWRPKNKQENLEPGAAEASEFDRFRIEAIRIAEETVRATDGGSYEMYERQVTQALQPHIDRLDPTLLDDAMMIACWLGYIDAPQA